MIIYIIIPINQCPSQEIHNENKAIYKHIRDNIQMYQRNILHGNKGIIISLT